VRDSEAKDARPTPRCSGTTEPARVLSDVEKMPSADLRDGRMLASDRDRNIHLSEAAAGKESFVLRGHTDETRRRVRRDDAQIDDGIRDVLSADGGAML